MVVEWKDPPPPGKRGHPKGEKRVSWWVRLTYLRSQPGRWAKVATIKPQQVSMTLHALRHRVNRYPPGAWEFVGRYEDGAGTIYARYLGEDESG